MPTTNRKPEPMLKTGPEPAVPSTPEPKTASMSIRKASAVEWIINLDATEQTPIFVPAIFLLCWSHPESFLAP
ncbi:hypothetical protein M9458_014627, partial [Cirrhinus mrigala]